MPCLRSIPLKAKVVIILTAFLLVLLLIIITPSQHPREFRLEAIYQTIFLLKKTPSGLRQLHQKDKVFNLNNAPTHVLTRSWRISMVYEEKKPSLLRKMSKGAVQSANDFLAKMIIKVGHPNRMSRKNMAY